MEQKTKLTGVSVACIAFILYACSTETVVNNKDLGQNMMDLRIYQENLGDHIKSGKLEDATWLLDGMDSIMVLLSDRVKEHRKLTKPFSAYYDKLMRDPVENMRNAIAEKDKAAATTGYRLLVKNCNGCHVNLEIDKEVKY